MAATAQRQLCIGLAIGLLGSSLFAGKAVIIKLAYRYGVSPEALLGLRMAMAAPLFAAVAWLVDTARGRSLAARLAPVIGAVRPWERRRGDGWRLFALGMTGYYLASLLDFLGLQYVSAGLERLVLYLNPTLVLVIGWLWFRQPIVRRQWLALAVCYAGVVLVYANDVHLAGGGGGRSGGGGSGATVLGTALVFASAVAYAIYLVSGGQMVKRLGSLRLTAWASLVSTLGCTVHALVVTGAEMFVLQSPVYGLSLINAVVCTFLPLFLVMMAVERLGSGLAAQAGMIGPAATIGLAAVFLDEPVTLLQLIGTAVVLGGLVLLARRR
ncbi:MAG: DMT family transporter [Burkholderiaceae bacterium]